MKKSINKFLFFSAILLLCHNSFAREIFAPMQSETWECYTNNHRKNNFTINIDNINLNSTGIYNGVSLESDESDLYSLTGAFRGLDYKYYSIVLIPDKLINYFKGPDELTISGKAIVYYEEYNDLLGKTQGNILYYCKVSLER